MRCAEQQAKQLITELPKVEAALPDKPVVPPKQPRKVLVFTAAKGFYHDSIPIAAKTIELMGKKTGAFEAVISDDPQMFAADKLQQFDAVVLDNNTGEFLPEESQRKNLVAFVRGGKGLIGVHAATDAFYQWADYGELVGGYFAGHPFSDITVKIDDPASPINAAFGGKGFEITDEIYTFKTPYSREKLHLLLSLDWPKSTKAQQAAVKAAEGNRWKAREDNDYALSWLQEYGKGRVFYCAFGHKHEIFWNQPILQHYLAGIQYALGDLAADAKPAKAAAR